MKAVLGRDSDHGWIYFIEKRFAWFPLYCQGTLVWLRSYWKTWPEDDRGPIMWRDIQPGDKSNDQAYVVYYPYDPRERR